jgi:hypothetical protein
MRPRLRGRGVPDDYMLGDVAVDWDLPRGYAYRSVHLVDGEMRNLLVAIPIPGDPRRYRLSLAAPPELWEEGVDLSVAPSLEFLAAATAPMLPAEARVGDLRWSSFYRISHRIAPPCRRE